MKALKSRKAILVILLVIVAVVVVFYRLNPTLNTKKYPLKFLSLNNDSKNIVAVFFETEVYNDFYRVDPATGAQEYSEAHEQTKGYLIEVVNPISGNVLNSVRLDRKLDEISSTIVFLNKENKVFLVHAPSFNSKLAPSIEVFSVKGDQLVLEDSPDVKDLQFVDAGATFIEFQNKYNEKYVLDFQTGSLESKSLNKKEYEPYKTGLTSQFFFVQLAPQSTRHFPYFLKYQRKNSYYAESSGETLMLYIKAPWDSKLNYNPSALTKVSNSESLKMYGDKIKQPEELRQLKMKEKEIVLNRPNVVYVDDSTCLLIAENTEERPMIYFLSKNAVEWNLELPSTIEIVTSLNLVSENGDFILSSDKNWILKVGSNGVLKWIYPKK